MHYRQHTFGANRAGLMEPIHERMPVILSPKEFDLWLDPQCKVAENLMAQALVRLIDERSRRTCPGWGLRCDSYFSHPNQ